MGKKRNAIKVDTKAILSARHDMGLSQEELAHKSKVTKDTISRIERTGSAYATTLRFIANALNVDVKQLLAHDSEIISEKAEKQTFKYFRDIRDVLKWDEKNIEPAWFRKSGPLAADFRAGYVYERKELLNELDELIANNKVSLLEGHGGSGKSVLIRNYAYNLISRQPDSTIYHFSFKTDAQIVDFHDFAAVLNSVTGLVIIEDIHLNTPEMQYVVEAFNNQKEISLVLTCHESFRKNLLNNRSQTHEKSPTLSLISNNGSRHYNDAREIVDCYCNKKKRIWMQKQNKPS